jgi:hypothetical protein
MEKLRAPPFFSVTVGFPDTKNNCYLYFVRGAAFSESGTTELDAVFFTDNYLIFQ